MLNALRHLRYWQDPGIGNVLDHGLDVLNALRHQRYWQMGPSCQISARLLCSTPCGIRGIGSWWSGKASAGTSGAQRLAASEVLAVGYFACLV